MEKLAEGLKTRFEAVLASDRDTLFYENLHHYYDLIEKTLSLKALLDASHSEYAEKHGAIWAKKDMSDDEADDASDRTMRLERFNLYARSATICVQVYWPIEIYKNNDDPEIEQDPYAVIMLRGADNIPRSYAKRDPFRWGDIRRDRKRYEGKRPYFEKELRQFHLLLLDAIDKVDAPVPMETTFDSERSLLTISGKPVRITLKNDKPNAHYVLEYLFENGKANVADYTDILKAKFAGERMHWRSVYRACKDVETKVRLQAKIMDFLMTTTGKTGYVRINSPYAESAGKTP